MSDAWLAGDGDAAAAAPVLHAAKHGGLARLFAAVSTSSCTLAGVRCPSPCVLVVLFEIRASDTLERRQWGSTDVSASLRGAAAEGGSR